MTNDDKPEYYEGIFADLTPERFQLDTSAIGQHWAVGSDYNVGEELFTKFVTEQLRTLETSWIAGRGKDIDPVAILATQDAQWVFVPDMDESLGDYVKRLRREAKQLRAHWVFISRLTAVTETTDSEPAHDATDPALIARYMENGGMVPALYYYAQRVDSGESQRRQGFRKVLPVSDGRRDLADLEEMSADQPNSFFDVILDYTQEKAEG